MKFTITKMVLLLFIIGVATYSFYEYKNKETSLGSFKNPEIALKETQIALTIISAQLNNGMKNVQRIKEYEEAKKKIFIEKQNSNHDTK